MITTIKLINIPIVSHSYVCVCVCVVSLEDFLFSVFCFFISIIKIWKKKHIALFRVCLWLHIFLNFLFWDKFMFTEKLQR